MKKKRIALLEEQGFRCHYCGIGLGYDDATIDHIVPEWLGGSDGLWNLVAACQPCNAKKQESVDDDHCDRCRSAVARWRERERLAGGVSPQIQSALDRLEHRFTQQRNDLADRIEVHEALHGEGSDRGRRAARDMLWNAIKAIRRERDRVNA